MPTVAPAPGHTEGFYRAFAGAVGQASPGGELLAALAAWEEAEGSQAAWNPFDSTYWMAGATAYNTFASAGRPAHVWSYADAKSGIDALLATLSTPAYGYPEILAAIRADDGLGLVLAVGASSWGTDGSLMRSAYDRLIAAQPTEDIVTPQDIDAIATAAAGKVIAALNAAGTGAGQRDFGGTVAAGLAVGQATYNRVASLGAAEAAEPRPTVAATVPAEPTAAFSPPAAGG